MSNIAIRVETLGKMYRIGGKQEKYSTLRDTLVDIAATPYRKIRGLMRGESASGLKEEIWALKDISFEVKHGEVVGIIGRNGAGKSTLLKILSRITEPTTGYADVYGRVGALLEVGTGFHPELTGRENVYLNGAILGMTRRDIDRRFDEIVDFAGVEKFIDTPVKHYSSGMGLRLGFAVAAHLEPEILVVDEVLAVGDAEFQKKCLGKMSEVAGEGRTVLFVSHNMAAVRNLCTRGLLLGEGNLIQNADTKSIIAEYLDTGMPRRLFQTLSDAKRTGDGSARFVHVAITRGDGVHGEPRIGDDLCIEVLIQSKVDINSLTICLVIWDSAGARIIDANTSLKQRYVNLQVDQYYLAVFRLKNVLLRPSTYTLELYMGIEHQRTIDYIVEATRFDILPNLAKPMGTVDYPGSYRCAFDIDIKRIKDSDILGEITGRSGSS